jgi:hypothetical protein
MKAKAVGVDAVERLLGQQGFRKRAGDVLTVELGRDVLGWLGLNRATRHHPAGEIEINPVVGVRHQGVEQIVAELRREKFHKYVPPTVSTSLGYLMPEHRYRPWILSAVGAVDPPAKMVEEVGAYALPFMRRLTELSELCVELDRGLGYEHQIAYRRPVAWMLSGNLARAHQVLDDELWKLGARTDPAAEDFRRFGEALRQRLASPAGGP